MMLFGIILWCSACGREPNPAAEQHAPPGGGAPAFEASVVLTRSESIALAVQKKGTCKISKSEALNKLAHHASSFSGSKKAAVQVKSAMLKKSPATGNDLYYQVVFEDEKGTGFTPSGNTYNLNSCVEIISHIY